MKKLLFSALSLFVILAYACKKTEVVPAPQTPLVSTKGSNFNSDSLLNLPSINYLDVDYPTYIDSIFKYANNWDNQLPENRMTNDGIALGRVLFYDKKLSVNNEVACASCHDIQHGFADPVAFSKGVNGVTKRNSMGLSNLRHFAQQKMFWDLRANNLEDLVSKPILDQIEMGNPDMESVVKRLDTVYYYPKLFENAFGSKEITATKISFAVAQFIRSIVSFDSKYDQGQSNNFSNFTASEKNGMNLFIARCGECHLSAGSSSANPKYLSFVNVNSKESLMGPGQSDNGLDDVYSDLGIGGITKVQFEEGTFKIPMLRNVELTAPYMHDGRFKTLEEVVNFYSEGVKNGPNKAPQIPSSGFRFSDTQKNDIIAFLKTLTDNNLSKQSKYSNPFKK